MLLFLYADWKWPMMKGSPPDSINYTDDFLRGEMSRIARLFVSIAPFKYFVDGIQGNFKVNINGAFVAPGEIPHIYEHSWPDNKLASRSAAYISNGYLGFEMTWLDRFMKWTAHEKDSRFGDKYWNDKSLSITRRWPVIENANPHFWRFLLYVPWKWLNLSGSF